MPSARVCLFVRRVGSFSYTPGGQICQVLLFVGWGVTFTRPVLESLASFGMCGVSPTYALLESVWSFSGCGVSPTCPRTYLCLVV